VVEVVGSRLSLQCEEMERVEYIESEGANRPGMSWRQQTCAQELGAVVRTAGAAIATAKLHVSRVYSIRVDDRELRDSVARNGAWVAVVTKKNSDPEGTKLDVCEMIARPMLSTHVRQRITMTV
jgi:hypothetical protein